MSELVEPLMSEEQEKWMVYHILRLSCPDDVISFTYHLLREMELPHAEVAVQDSVTTYHKGKRESCVRRFSGLFVPKEKTKRRIYPLIVFSRTKMNTYSAWFRNYVLKSYSSPYYLEQLEEVKPIFEQFVHLVFHEIGHLYDYYLYGYATFEWMCIRDARLPHDSRELEIRANKYADNMTEYFLSKAFEYKDWYFPDSVKLRRVSEEETPWLFELY